MVKGMFRIINLILVVLAMWITTLLGADAAMGGVAYLAVLTADMSFDAWAKEKYNV